MLIGTDFTNVETTYRIGRRRNDYRNANQPSRTTLVMRVALAVAGAVVVTGALTNHIGEAASEANRDQAAHLLALNSGPAWEPNLELLAKYRDGTGRFTQAPGHPF